MLRVNTFEITNDQSLDVYKWELATVTFGFSLAWHIKRRIDKWYKKTCKRSFWYTRFWQLCHIGQFYEIWKKKSNSNNNNWGADILDMQLILKYNKGLGSYC